MTYLPTADHDELRAMVRELASERIAPRAAEIDEKAEFPWDLKDLLASQDLLGTCFSEDHGGTALDTLAQTILVEEISRADATTSLIPIVQKLGALPIILAGTTEQKMSEPVDHPQGVEGARRQRRVIDREDRPTGCQARRSGGEDGVRLLQMMQRGREDDQIPAPVVAA